MLITSTVEFCIQQLGQAEEMVFTARRSYASAVLGVVILSVCHTRALWLIQRTYRGYFLYHMKGQSFYSYVIFRTDVQQLKRFQLT